LTFDKPQVATIGFFDGVHKGHQHVVNAVIDEARRRNMESMVITFDRHPRSVVDTGYMPQMLSTIDDKLQLFSLTALDNCVVLPFDAEMAMFTAKQFMTDVLMPQLNVKVLMIGYDNHFGHRISDEEGFDDYVDYGKQIGIEVLRADEKMVQGVDVSSSVIRAFISEGEMQKASACLGRQYMIRGTVVTGHKIGRELGFPTANIDPSSVQTMIPSAGVYAVKVRIAGDDAVRRGVMNIGSRPTFDDGVVSLEVHIIDFTGDLYGKTLSVYFDYRIREEKKFGSKEELIKQLRKDVEQTIQV